MQKVIAAAAALLCASAARAESIPATDPLEQSIRDMDAALFDRGFNRCDLAIYETILAEDLEFYHDLGGASFGRANFISDVRKGICASDFHPRRELVAEAFRVFPLSSDGELYGAIEQGEHKFFQTPPGGAERQTGIAKFTLLWMKAGDSWILKRALSYDHQAAPTAGE